MDDVFNLLITAFTGVLNIFNKFILSMPWITGIIIAVFVIYSTYRYLVNGTIGGASDSAKRKKDDQ